MSEPLFRVGEEVILCSENHPDRDGDYVILDFRHGKGMCEVTGQVEIVFMYKLETGIDSNDWWHQDSLRKKHKPSDESFKEMMKNLKKVTA